MRSRECCHLRHVRHHDHLRVLGQPGQTTTNRGSRRSTDTSVHLIEHECPHGVGVGQNDLQSQHDPAQLTSGGGFADRCRGRTGVCAEQERHIVLAVRAELPSRHDHLECGVRHGQFPKLRGRPILQPVGQRTAGCGQILRGLGDSTSRRGLLSLQPVNVQAPLQHQQFRACPLRPLQDIRAVPRVQRRQIVQPFVEEVQPARLVLQTVEEPRQLPADVGDVLGRGDEPLPQTGQLRVLDVERAGRRVQQVRSTSHLVLAQDGYLRCPGGRAEIGKVHQPMLLGLEIDGLARLGVDLLDLLQSGA